MGNVFAEITDAVHIQWKDRFAVVNAMVLPEGKPLALNTGLETMRN